jgi:hypothetical protein
VTALIMNNRKRSQPREARPEQAMILAVGFTQSNAWPRSLVEQVAGTLAAALVQDMRDHHTGEFPASERPS